MKKLVYFTMLTVLIFIVSCESPMKVQINELENIIGSDFNRNVLKDDGDFSVGYYNGKITTSKVELSWSETMEDNFAFYKLTRNNVELAVFNDISIISFQDTLVNENSYYDYQITVFAENGMVAKDTIEIKTAQWQPPSNLRINGLSETDIQLAWDDNSDSEDYFKIYFYDNSRSLIDSFTVDNNVTEKIVIDLDPTETYYFNIIAEGQWEEETLQSPQEGFDMTDFVFDPPTNLNCSQNSNMSIELNWEDNSTLETGFSIERKINSGNFMEIVEIEEINLEIYTDMDITAYEIGDILTYRVRALNNYETLEYTNYSNEIEIAIVETPSYPTPEYFGYGPTSWYLEIEYSGETDVFEWTSYGNDLDIDIFNYSDSMDIAVRIWDEFGNYLGEFNDNGTGSNDYLDNIGYGEFFIIEVFDVNNTTGYYDIYIN